ncbi:MAG: SMP-30/gluconolactonase/LRE family protein [Candidatus Symbiothrix sp.]|jgi:sugar lactone lactonase YvrE|nr:SMP-30/gluconolactonase/LRE family protein [Candidatus Symbiothrix sp.]
MKHNQLIIFLTVLMAATFACKEAYNDGTRELTPPDPNRESAVTTYFPDSGGIATKLILYGTNFGTDTAYIKVTVNGRKAAVIGSDGEALHAIVPRQAGSGPVKVFIGKEPNVKELTYDNPFRYSFRENVTTIVGVTGEAGIEDSDPEKGVEGKLRRPWFVAFDRDGEMYIIDEGRGANADGGIRRYADGVLTTMARNANGAMMSPTVCAFSIDAIQDTLYMLNSLWTDNSMENCTATLTMFLRNEGYKLAHGIWRDNPWNSRSTAMAVHPVTGEIFFNSQATQKIYKYDSKTASKVEQISIQAGTDKEQRMVFSNDGSTLYIAVTDQHCIYKAAYNSRTATLEKPTVWVGQVGKSGHQDAPGAAALFNEPKQLTIDQYGIVFVADKRNHCIRRIDAEGNVTTHAGTPGVTGSKDGALLESSFNEPECVTFNPVDFGLYVADRNNHVVRRIIVE